jgi:hypothetical protein
MRSIFCVTSESSDPSDGRAPTEHRTQTLRFQPLVNVLVRGLLRVPVVSRGVGARLVTVYVVGRKSGKRYSVPVAYTPHEGSLIFGTPFAWGRNLRTGEPVAVRYKGKRRQADVEVFTDEEGVVEQYEIIARDNHQFAEFNKIGLDQDGNPSRADLQLAWEAGARAFRLTLR